MSLQKEWAYHLFQSISGFTAMHWNVQMCNKMIEDTESVKRQVKWFEKVWRYLERGRYFVSSRYYAVSVFLDPVAHQTCQSRKVRQVRNWQAANPSHSAGAKGHGCVCLECISFYSSYHHSIIQKKWRDWSLRLGCIISEDFSWKSLERLSSLR